MKNLRITVNGTAYDVVVEELGTSAAPAAKPAAVPAPAAKPAAAPAAPAVQGGVKIDAPMPGTIVSVAVSNGQSVKKGDVLVVLEAMKMENEIFAPQDGVVASVSCAKGETVDSGKTLITLK